jgi:signal transduction histidine kinase
VPFIARDRVLGLATVATYHRLHEFKPEQVTRAMGVSNSIALAIENALLYEQHRDIAIADERNRMAREIHDTLAQGLSEIVLQLEAAEQVLVEDPAEALQHVDRARGLARKSLQEARRSVWNLVPGPLEKYSLDEALLREVQETASISELEAAYVCDGTPFPISREAQICLLRACQEALSNVRKHAEANRVEVTLNWADSGVTLTVQDNGRGFAGGGSSDGGAGGGFGLIGLRQRCELIRAEMSVDSRLRAGTTVRVFIPR